MISEAIHEFLQDLLADARRSHLSVTMDPVASSFWITVEASDEDLRRYADLLGEIEVKDDGHG